MEVIKNSRFTSSANRIESTGVGVFGTGTTTCMYNLPIQVGVVESGESIEFIFKETPSVSYTSFPPSYPPDKVFKIVFSCVDGKWHKSDRIYGEVIAASDETYEFD